MIKHIVLWKLDNSYKEVEKESILKELRTRLLNLEGKISELIHIEVYLGAKDAASTNYDIMLDTVFNSLKDLSTYAQHPEHLKVGEYLKTLKVERSAIDFSF